MGWAREWDGQGNAVAKEWQAKKFNLPFVRIPLPPIPLPIRFSSP
jgi:hypothetical protein